MSRTRICVPIVSATPPIEEQAHAARVAGAELLELRVDLIGDVPAVERFLASRPALPVILTIRSRDEGGGWQANDDERIALIERLGLLLPGWVDIELATWRRSANLRQKVGLVAGIRDHEISAHREDRESRRVRTGGRPRNGLIISAHNLAATPGDIRAVFDALLATPSDAIKGAFAAADASDALRVLIELERCAADRDTIALAMGEAGLAARVLARKFGALLTFATLERGSKSAPGQPTVAELRGLYRWDAICRATRVFGVVGWPVAHSQSPLVHNTAMAATGIDGAYVPLPVAPRHDAFQRFMDLIIAHPQLDIAGLSVTIPHKEHALHWLDEHGGRVTPLARRCGAVNTLARGGDGVWTGDNTDASGALAAIRSHARWAAGGFCGTRALVLGAGGAARAVVAALVDAGVEVTIANRTPSRAAALGEELGAKAIDWSQRGGHACDLLINCTSVGLWPDSAQSPMPSAVPDARTVVFDTVYRPRRTRLLQDAERAGCATISGVEMFLCQAAAQFERWHGGSAPLQAMRSVLDTEVEAAESR
jgi:3-dehydroquinate dehydratase/shikimate dehydrogenase